MRHVSSFIMVLEKNFIRRIHMSHQQFTKKILGIEDPNITLEEEWQEVTRNKVKHLCIRATLTASPSYCPCCGQTEPKKITRYGFAPSKVLLPHTAQQPVLLLLNKQRFYCKECGSTFQAETNLVSSFCNISNPLRAKIYLELTQKKSEKQIAYDNAVSANTITRYVDTNFEHFEPDYNSLPAHLCFDEFKSTKRCEGAMSFLFIDASTHQIIDILPSRTSRSLSYYFSKYTKTARQSVRTISMDIYPPYMEIARRYFPNADIILDRFHIVQNLTRAFNSLRIQVMKQFAKDSMEYKRLKRYWKLFLKTDTDLDATDFRHFTHFKQRMTVWGVVEKSVSASTKLKSAYDAMQLILGALRSKNPKSLKARLCMLLPKLCDNMKTACKTMLTHFPKVVNAMIYPWNNGAIESINNRIKVLKRLAFGFRSFFHFRNRILICSKLILLKQKERVRQQLSPDKNALLIS